MFCSEIIKSKYYLFYRHMEKKWRGKKQSFNDLAISYRVKSNTQFETLTYFISIFGNTGECFYSSSRLAHWLWNKQWPRQRCHFDLKIDGSCLTNVSKLVLFSYSRTYVNWCVKAWRAGSLDQMVVLSYHTQSPGIDFRHYINQMWWRMPVIEVEVGGTEAQGHPQLYNEFKDKPCLKK